MNDEVLRLDALHVAYSRGASVLDDLSLGLVRGEIGCVVGASGCGKTTLLRAIAGFLPVTRGTIHIGEELVASAHRTVPPEKRGVGLVFQDFALFPHLRIEDNVAFGLRDLPAKARAQRAQAM